jgi:hypothetical protein
VPLQKQPVNINFAQGLDTKTDPFQVQLGKFLNLENTIFTKGGLLQKRNGFGELTTLSDTAASFLTTFNGNITAIGTSVQAYSANNKSWVTKGSMRNLGLETLPLVRNSLNQTYSDMAVDENGLACVVYSETDGTTTTHKYAIIDTTTGQNIVAPTALPSADATYGHPRAFLLDRYFVILYTTHPSAYSLKYLAISRANTSVTHTDTISSNAQPRANVSFDGYVFNNSLYIGFEDASEGISLTSLSNSLQLSATTVIGGVTYNLSICVDEEKYVIWIVYSNGSAISAFALSAVGFSFSSEVILDSTSNNIRRVVSTAKNGTVYAYFECANTYAFDTAVPSYLIRTSRGTTAGPVIGSKKVVARSVGLASKPFWYNNKIHLMAAHQSPYQPSYFLLNVSDSLEATPIVYSRLAYQNGGGYVLPVYPNANFDGRYARIPYLYKDLITSVNKNTNVPAGTQTAGIYSQTGINMVTYDFEPEAQITSEIGSALHLSGGLLWQYDGYTPMEHNFLLYPELDATKDTGSGGGWATTSTTGNLAALLYYYVATYEWTDNQGIIHRSAPSIPIAVDLTGAGTSTSKNTIRVPSLRLTYKTSNPVKICLYRWSTAQQSYYQITSVSAPTQNTLTADYVTITDTSADATILGNSLLYTTGGVVENTAAPAVSALTLFKSRLMFLDAEDSDRLGYSKQVIENTPVELSDLFSLYIAPTAGAQGSTGKSKCLAPLDDKLIIFKKDAIYYMTGTGPDNTGANNDFSEPAFITSTVGCENQKSIVFIPAGLMFQSDKGIWLLDRSLGTSYIGAPVEEFTKDAKVLSAVNVPGTNQVRFTMDSGKTLMYDYYWQQWGTFTGLDAKSSTLFQGLHTFIDTYGRVYQETPGLYLDGSRPVLVKFTTSWFALAGLQGYERAYYFNLLGTYISPNWLVLGIAYDYNPTPQQTSTIAPDNYDPPWGSDATWGTSSPFGGPSAIEEYRVFLKKQKCESFQISLQEVYDPSFGVRPGAGMTLSGISLIVGAKKGWRTPAKASHSVG